jgi:multicomponent Na+:H+ antiporter subunit F
VSAFLAVATVAVGVLIALALHRVVRGPTIPDRLVGTALATANSVILLVLIGFVFGRIEMFVDIAIAYAVLAFLFPIALAKQYVRNRDR